MNTIKKSIVKSPSRTDGVVTNTLGDANKDNCKEIQDEGILKYESYLAKIENMIPHHKVTIEQERKKKVSYGGVSFVYGDKVHYKNKIWFVGHMDPQTLSIRLIPKDVVEDGIFYPYNKNAVKLRLPEFAMFNDIKSLKRGLKNTDE